ncbi:hypothetical protein [Planctobacterium marinum]|uniref:hypothetical protein n=1 Tax=Planctobacterium marinum TaxID=1631968 RepID=UPI001E4C12A2|nr:hypothetical protein [Planctobacterium marinum]MCC2607724.1 hypothetical protein [Planctobacterium marinum]
MKSKLQNGFYWICIKDKEAGSESEVAKFINGEWYVTGSTKSFSPDEYEIVVLSPCLTIE